MNGRPLYQSTGLFALYAVACLILAVRQLPFGLVVGWFVGGALLFTLVEYLAHRYFFHLTPSSHFRAKVQFAVHGNHHAAPTNHSDHDAPAHCSRRHPGNFVRLLRLDRTLYDRFSAGLFIGLRFLLSRAFRDPCVPTAPEFPPTPLDQSPYSPPSRRQNELWCLIAPVGHCVPNAVPARFNPCQKTEERLN